jgi:Cu2+-containing amine oxidase
MRHYATLPLSAEPVLSTSTMTVRTSTQVDGVRQAPGPSHPLQRLGADEIRRARSVLAEHGLVGEPTRFAYLGLEEPPKGEVLAFRPGQPSSAACGRSCSTRPPGRRPTWWRR